MEPALGSLKAQVVANAYHPAVLIIGFPSRLIATITEPAGVLLILLAVVFVVSRLEKRAPFDRLFKYVPSLVFYYFVPTLLNLIGVIPRQSDAYVAVKHYVLPGSLVLLTLSLNVPALLKLGRKTVAVFLASSLSILIGGPIALAIWKSKLPHDAWRPMAYLAGSWIGGAANAVAAKESVGASDTSVNPLIIVDVVLSYAWMTLLLTLAARRQRIDRWLGARFDPAAMHSSPVRIGSIRNLGMPPELALLAIGLIAGYCSALLAAPLATLAPRFWGEDAWRCMVATAFGIAASFTWLRNLERAGASRVGMWMLFLLVGVIGAGADFSRIRDAGPYFGLGATWLLIHVIILFAVGRLLRAPLFLLAVSSQANIGGPVSAPVVAAAFEPALAPVGAILAIAGYAIGTFGALACARLCHWVSG